MKKSKVKMITGGTIIGIILLLYLLRGWWIPKIIVGLGGYLNKETKTEYIEGTIDTNAVFSDYVLRKGIILNPKPEIILKDTFIYRKIIIKDIDTFYVDSTKIITDKLLYFKSKVEDSILKGKMHIYNKPDGTLFGADLEYALKTLKQVDTVKETTILSNCITKNYIGLGISANNLGMPGINLSYTTKKKWEVDANYSKNIFNSPVYNGGDKVQVIGTLTISKKW